MAKITDFIYKTLTPRVAPMVYIMMFVSVFIGFCFFTGLLVGGGESVLFASGALIPVNIWGLLLFITATTTEIGLILGKWRLVSYGGIGGFMLWLLATIDLLLGAHYYVLVVMGVFHLLFHGYVYLSSALGVLERQTYWEVSEWEIEYPKW